MERLNILSRFLGKAAHDSRLLPTHISLYIAMMSMWEQNSFSIPFRITRKELMRLSKLASTATYHKCLKELVNYGYVIYEPSYNHYLGSRIYLTTL
ncbi:MAG: hypothetical protein ACYCZO_14700 [Daejeonella sp.]